MAFDEGNGLKHIFNIAMTPVLALNGGDRSDI